MSLVNIVVIWYSGNQIFHFLKSIHLFVCPNLQKVLVFHLSLYLIYRHLIFSPSLIYLSGLKTQLWNYRHLPIIINYKSNYSLKFVLNNDVICKKNQNIYHQKFCNLIFVLTGIDNVNTQILKTFQYDFIISIMECYRYKYITNVIKIFGLIFIYFLINLLFLVP